MVELELKDKDWSPQEKKIRENFIRDLHEFAENVPQPETSWDLIWVISGPEKSLLHSQEDASGHQTYERFEGGFRIQKEVTALRLGKEAVDVTVEDIRKRGPTVFYDGTDIDNRKVRELVGMGFFEKEFGVPREKLIIETNPTIKITAHQFETFPMELLPDAGKKLVIVSDLYHLPRIKRLHEYWSVKRNWETPRENVVIAPAQPKLRVRRAMQEVHNIPKYILAGFLPEEGKD